MCGARVQSAAMADFDSTPISCSLAYGKVLGECPKCIVCPIGDTGCDPDATTTSTTSTSTTNTNTNTSTTATSITTTTVMETVTVTGGTNTSGLHVIGDMSSSPSLRLGERSVTPARLDPRRYKRKLQLGHHGQPTASGGVAGWHLRRLQDFWKPAAMGFVGLILLCGSMKLWCARDREARQAVHPHMALPQADPEPRRVHVAPLIE